jgi:RNA polymerase sigma-70 factor (ECF subfamily)
MSADERARFEALYAATREPILAFLLRRVDQPEDAADLLAEVYLVAWRRLDDVPAGDGGRMWLYGVARRMVANHRRGDRRRGALADQLAATLRTAPLAGDHDHGPLAAALARLPEADRELIALHAWDGLAPAEIAAVVGARAATVRVRLHRARTRLARLLEEEPRPAPAVQPRARPYWRS